MRIFLCCLVLILHCNLAAQSFTKVTAIAIDSDTPTGGYAGASWIDYDGDGHIDLFVNQDFLYRNDGNGGFPKIVDSGIIGSGNGLNNGNSWADIDNDGDPDLALVNQSNNGVFINNNDGTFSKITTGDIATNLNAWSAAWADYDNDGWVDLFATHPCGFIGTCHGNWLFNNNGDGSFTEIANSPVNAEFAAFTVGNWADFDDDGDQDIFVGSGEVNSSSRDHFYINQLNETGSADFILNQSGALFGDLRDGQNWNLIDYDNDGDLDAFVTNYKSDIPNDFYKNNGDGSFTKLTTADLQVHMVEEIGIWLGNTWGDYNNDGWIDVFMTADFGSPFGNHVYLNNGDGTFSHHFPIFANQVGSRATVNGDYDNDGDLDIFINASQSNVRGLYRNDLAAGNAGKWVNISLEGTTSNRSAIGAKVRVKALINGQAIWQRRDISSQSGFCGQNDLRVHFGLGNAENIDSLIIEWPLGLNEIYTNLSPNQFLNFTESQLSNITDQSNNSIFLNIYPNPLSIESTITYAVNSAIEKIELSIVDASANTVKYLFTGSQAKGQYQMKLKRNGLPTGTYYLVLKNGPQKRTEPLVILK